MKIKNMWPLLPINPMGKAGRFEVRVYVGPYYMPIIALSSYAPNVVNIWMNPEHKLRRAWP
jgi:hypothetical protein